MNYFTENQIARFGHARSALTLNVPNLPEEFYGGDKLFLVDAGISYRLFSGYYSYTYAVTGVKMENEGWANHLEGDHFLETCTREKFRNNSGSISLTAAFDTHGPKEEATVHYSTEGETVTCAHCGAPTNVTLTSGGTTVYVCQNLSSTDFGSLVQAVAFPRFILVTNEYCLGWSSAPLGSYLLEKDRKTKYKIIYGDIKNNV